jgi:FMN-dependent NADH-azoreductase
MFSMSSSFFEWDRYVGTHMTPVDAVKNARAAGQTFDEYAQEYAANQPADEVSNDELANGMVGDMQQAAHNLAHHRVVGNPDLSPHESTLFADIPADADNYYAWLETADESEILEQVTTRESE